LANALNKEARKGQATKNPRSNGKVHTMVCIAPLASHSNYNGKA